MPVSGPSDGAQALDPQAGGGATPVAEDSAASGPRQAEVAEVREEGCKLLSTEVAAVEDAETASVGDVLEGRQQG